MKHQKVAIIALGKRNAGKSNTWYEIFGRKIRSGLKRLLIDGQQMRPFVRNASFEEKGDEIEDYFEVFVINASPEESSYEPEDWLDEAELPCIVFCSVQYVEHGIKTITWFKEHGYYLYIQWLNPGYHGSEEYPDHLEFEKKFSSSGTFTKCSGKEKKKRTNEIMQFLAGFNRRQK